VISGPVFLDACIPIYAAGSEHHYKEPCRRILEAVAEREIEAVTDVEVVQEIAYRYHAIRRPEGVVLAEEFLLLVPEVLPVTRSAIAYSLELLKAYPSVRPRDAIHAAVMVQAGIEIIVTADGHFDIIEEVRRLDPTAVRWGGSERGV
jgi:predicted nucleic acid-binding protein